MLPLKIFAGFITGAIIGAMVAVGLVGVWFFMIYPMTHRVNWDNPGISFMPMLAAPFGAIVGAAIGAVLGARR